jgi:hypothetical protein
MDDVMRNNPQLAKQMAAAAAAQAGPGFGNFMGMAMGVPQPAAPQASMSMDPPGMTGAFFGNNSRSAPNPSQQAAAAAANPRREMKGPSGVDDILKTFEEVRRAEMESVGVMPPPVNTMQQQQPAMVAVSELQSVVTDDFGGSQAESSRGGRRGRGRRSAISGNTVSIDV